MTDEHPTPDDTAAEPTPAPTLEPNTVAIVRLGWARYLQVPDDALAAPVVTVPRDDVVSVIRLFGTTVAVGPAWFLADERLWVTDGPELLHTVTGHEGTASARLVGEATIAYTDTYVDDPRLAVVEVSDEPDALAAVVRESPADDVEESALTTMPRVLVTLAEGSDTVLAAAGHDVWGGLVGQLGVLTPPDRRGRGHGTVAAGLATNDALDSGLVAQWRARAENAPALAVAARLGFVQAGSQTTVRLA